MPGGAETQRLFFAIRPEPELRERLFALGDDRLRAGGRRVVAEKVIPAMNELTGMGIRPAFVGNPA